MIVQTCSLFRQIPDWKSQQTTFEDYKLHNMQPDFYGRDADLSYPHVHHIHLAQDEHVAKRWATINQIFYRVHSVKAPEEDYWLLYAFDDFSESYLLLTIIGSHAHDNKRWRSYLSSIYQSFVEPWINGRLTCVI
ncbi:MAG: mRNA interferase YafO [Phenylobacterium sp.]